MNLRQVVVGLGMLVFLWQPQASWAQSPPFAGRAADFILLLAERDNLSVGIDPEVMRELAELELEIAVPAPGAGVTTLETALKPHGYIVPKVELAPSLTVWWVTTPAAWGYRQATGAMVRGDLRQLFATLRTLEQDNSPLGQCSAALLEALTALWKHNQNLQQLEGQIRDNVAAFRRAKADIQLAETAARSLSGGSSRSAMGMAEDRYQKAVADAEKSYATLREFHDKMAEGNQQVGQQFVTAYARGYLTEARYLFEQLVHGAQRLHQLLGVMQQEGMLKDKENLGQLPDPVVNLRIELQRNWEENNADLKAALAQASTAPAQARSALAQAYWSDRSVLHAAVALGWADLQANRQSWRTILDASAQPNSSRLDKFERSLRAQDKLGLLKAWIEMRTGTAAKLAPPIRTKVGTARGLAVADGKGELLPVATRIETVPERPVEAETKTDDQYWNSVLMQRLRQQDEPVSFGDYGRKDQWMLVAAVEAYRWLRSIDGTFRENPGVAGGGAAGDLQHPAFVGPVAGGPGDEWADGPSQGTRAADQPGLESRGPHRPGP